MARLRPGAGHRERSKRDAPLMGRWIYGSSSRASEGTRAGLRAAIEVVGFGRRQRDRSAVSRHEVRRNCEPKAGADLARRFVERLENALALIGRKSGPGVADLDQRQSVGANGGE